MIFFILALVAIFSLFWFIDYGPRPRPRKRPQRKTNLSQDNNNLLLLLLAFVIGMEIGD